MGDDTIEPRLQTVAALTLTINWVPSQGRLEVNWPAIDDVAKLGMLEMAKLVLVEARAKASVGEGPPLIVPGRFAS